MLRERGLRASEERMRRSLEAAGLGHWDYDYVSETLVWSEQTRKLLGVEPGGPASRPRLRSRATAHGSRNTSRAAPTSMPITFPTSGSA
jgi:PAS domain-containing protein